MPAAIVAILYDESGTTRLLILSQVILSLQLSFAVFPLCGCVANEVRHVSRGPVLAMRGDREPQPLKGDRAQ